MGEIKGKGGAYHLMTDPGAHRGHSFSRPTMMLWGAPGPRKGLGMGCWVMQWGKKSSLGEGSSLGREGILSEGETVSRACSPRASIT